VKIAPKLDPTIIFAASGGSTVGVYVGAKIQNFGIASTAIQQFINQILEHGISKGLLMQLCGPGRDADYVFGIIAATDSNFSTVHSSVRSWADAECVMGFDGTSQSTNTTVYLITPRPTFTTNITNTTTVNSLRRRGDCTTIQVVSGDGCASLAQKCGITGAAFTSYNPTTNLCSTLQPSQHVCCSAGTLPNFQPQPNSNGSCAVYTTVSGDSCSAIAATNSLTVAQLESFNSDTWGTF